MIYSHVIINTKATTQEYSASQLITFLLHWWSSSTYFQIQIENILEWFHDKRINYVDAIMTREINNYISFIFAM